MVEEVVEVVEIKGVGFQQINLQLQDARCNLQLQINAHYLNGEK